jgi:hypothetical protein
MGPTGSPHSSLPPAPLRHIVRGLLYDHDSRRHQPSFQRSTFAPVARMRGQLMNHSPSDFT